MSYTLVIRNRHGTLIQRASAPTEDAARQEAIRITSVKGQLGWVVKMFGPPGEHQRHTAHGPLLATYRRGREVPNGK